MINFTKNITPELIGIAIGFLLRHFLMPIISGKETKDLLKYLKKQETTKDQLKEIEFLQAECRHWQEIHELTCPYMHRHIKEAKEVIKHIANGGK